MGLEFKDLEELDHGECLRLLAAGIVGRVVFTDAALPAAQPVNYLLDGEEILFRTRSGSKLAAATRNAVVAFEADEIDAATHSGWSVLGVGAAYEVTEPGRLTELAERMPSPWVNGHTAHTIAIPLQQLTGRRLQLGGGGAGNGSSDAGDLRPDAETDAARTCSPT